METQVENPIATLEQKAELTVRQYQTDANELAKRAKAAKFTCDDDITACNAIITAARKLRKLIDNTRLEDVRPVNFELKRIKAIFDGVTNPLQETEATLIQKLNNYRAMRRREQAEAEAKAQAEEARRAKISESKGGDGTVKTPVEREPSFEAKDTTKVRKTWKHEVIDRTKLPAEFILADNVAIRQAMLGAVSTKTISTFEIPGVRFYQEEGWSS